MIARRTHLDFVLSEIHGSRFSFLSSVLGQHKPGGIRSLLDLACSNGRLAMRFAGSYHVTGLDRSQRMIACARLMASLHSGIPATFQRSELRSLTFPPGTFDAAYCFGFALSSLPWMTDIRTHLRAVRRVLVPRGLYVFNLLLDPPIGPYDAGALLIDGDPITWKSEVLPASGNAARWSRQIAYTINGLLQPPIIVRRRSPKAVARTIAMANFKIIAKLDGYTLQPATSKSAGITYVCRA